MPTPTPVVSTVPPPTALPASARTLIKLACPANASADDACKAVYYIGADGKRHAFPNGRVFFTWYRNFDAVQTVSQETLSAYPLGRNVTYRPGARMVKFETLNRVYAVDAHGTLRWVTSEQAATAIYGADWNKEIDDISDVFYTDYTFGTDIVVAGDFDAAQALNLAPTFD